MSDSPEALGSEMHRQVVLPVLRRRWRDGAPARWIQITVTSFYRFSDPNNPPGSYLPGTRGVGKGTMADGSILDFDFGDIVPVVDEQGWALTGNGHAWFEDRLRVPA